jgi:hypothetical protein
MEENVWSLAANGLKYKNWANSEDRLQFIVSTGTGFSDLILSLKKAEDTCVSSGIQTYNISFHVAEDLSS